MASDWSLPLQAAFFAVINKCLPRGRLECRGPAGAVKALCERRACEGGYLVHRVSSLQLTEAGDRVRHRNHVAAIRVRSTVCNVAASIAGGIRMVALQHCGTRGAPSAGHLGPCHERRRPGTCARGVIAELRARERGGLIGPGSPFLIGAALATEFRRLTIATDWPSDAG